MEEESESRSEWKWLPSDLLFIIFTNLPLPDLIRSALVCKRWRLSAAGAYPHRPTLPFLGYPRSNHPYQLYSISDRTFYALKLSPEHKGYGLNSIHQDWMGFRGYSEDKSMPFLYFLYNPFSGARLQLPPIGPSSSWPPAMPALTFSCNPNEHGCRAAYFRNPSEGIAFCSVGDNHADWKMIPCDEGYQNIVFHNDIMYLVTVWGGLDVADPVSMETKPALPPPTMKKLPYLLGLYVSQRLPDLCYGAFDIFSSEDELLMVCAVSAGLYSARKPIAIYRADFELGRWEILDNFKGRAVLFDGHSLLLVQPDKLYGLEEDCLYFIGQKELCMFRTSPQSCRTYNLVENGQEDDAQEYDSDEEGDRKVKDNYELLHPRSLDESIFYMITPQPKFFVQ